MFAFGYVKFYSNMNTCVFMVVCSIICNTYIVCNICYTYINLIATRQPHERRQKYVSHVGILLYTETSHSDIMNKHKNILDILEGMQICTISIRIFLKWATYFTLSS